MWTGILIIWKKPETWIPTLSEWLKPHFRKDGMRRLKPGVFRDICWDDTDWLDVFQRSIKPPLESLLSDLSDALLEAKVRTYHGCRTEDAGEYFRNGILTHDKVRLKSRALEIANRHSELRYLLQRLNSINTSEEDIDDGVCFLVVSDEALLNEAAHYLFHGSEWIMSQFDEPARGFLRNIGAPTLLEVDFPLSRAHSDSREAFAKDMLMEWTRITCNAPDWSAPINHTFFVNRTVPPDYIVGHSHPAEMRNPHDRERVYRSPSTTYRYCEPKGAE